MGIVEWINANVFLIAFGVVVVVTCAVLIPWIWSMGKQLKQMSIKKKQLLQTPVENKPVQKSNAMLENFKKISESIKNSEYIRGMIAEQEHGDSNEFMTPLNNDIEQEEDSFSTNFKNMSKVDF